MYIILSITIMCVAGGCEPGQFACETEGGRCYDESYICDGVSDCIQQTNPLIAFDEQGCPMNGK